MAASNLFPPIIDTYMPAFTSTGDKFKVTFELSPFNKIDDIKKTVQVSIRDLYSNLNLLKNKTEILFCEMENEISNIDNGKYTITINKSDLANGEFEINSFYKILLRFVSSSAPQIENTIDWLNNNLEHFSEWSTVCLIKCISNFEINLTLPDAKPNNNMVILQLQFNTIYGNVTFNDKSNNETLKSYRIILKETNALEDIVYLDSGDLYFEYNKLSFAYKLKYQLELNKIYTLYIEIVTKNLYIQVKEIKILYNPNEVTNNDLKITAIPQEDVGRNKIIISFLKDFNQNLIIKRTSNKDNFNYWEDIHITNLIASADSNYTWYDYTVESGVWYKYAVQAYSNNTYTTATIIDLPIINVFDDIFLNYGNKQLKIKYNPQLNSLNRVVLDSKTDTIGSKYPFFSRSSVTNYKTFPIGGLISFMSDEQELDDDETQCYLFTSREKTYGALSSLYEEYNLDNNITQYNDILYEREFREQVMDFLYDNSLKLFRSTQEGNILVKLMDINFTPLTSLGRMVYSFSATAYEADECTIENYDKYNIQRVGTLINTVNEIYTKYYYVMGEIQNNDNNNQYLLDTNLIDIIYSKLNNDKVSIKKFSQLKISFLDEPYLLKNTEYGVQKALPEEKNTYLGYLININGNNIAVNDSGVYELEGETGYLISTFEVIQGRYIFDYVVQVSCIVSNKEESTVEAAAAPLSLIPMSIGLLQDTFDSGIDIIEIIKGKHTNIENVVSLSIEGDSNVVCYIKTNKDSNSLRYVLGTTEFLCINEDDVNIESCIFNGITIDGTDVLKPVEAIVNYKYTLT